MPMSTVSAMASTPPNSIFRYANPATTKTTMNIRLMRMRIAISRDPVHAMTMNTTRTHASQIDSAVDMMASTCVAVA